LKIYSWEDAQTFVELALSIEPHFPGYVDACFGPAEIREAAAGEQMLYEFVHVASRPLRKAGNNQLLLLHERGASDEQVIAYGRRYSLSSEQQEIKYLQFAKDPLWRSYGFNYSLGYELVANWLARAADPEQAFARLLREPTTPARLERRAGQ
jgi:hypothetical protein